MECGAEESKIEWGEHQVRTFRTSLVSLILIVLFWVAGVVLFRRASPLWAGVAFFATWGILVAAFIGAAATQGRLRAWWLGFTVFGWGYMLLAFMTDDTWKIAVFFDPTPFLEKARLRPWLPSYLLPNELLNPVDAHLRRRPRFLAHHDPAFQISQCVCALFCAIVGAAIGCAFGEPSKVPAETSAGSLHSAPSTPRRHRRVSGSSVMFGVTAGTLLLIVSTRGSEEWSDVVFLLTGGLLGACVLGAVLGRSRSCWGGAALFGWGYLWLALNTPVFRHHYQEKGLPGLDEPPVVNAGCTRVPFLRDLLKTRADFDPRNAPILRALALPFPARFPESEGWSLSKALDIVRLLAVSEELPNGIPFYVMRPKDPDDREEPTEPAEPTIALDLQPGEVCIATGLIQMLGPNYGFIVENGRVTILPRDIAPVLLSSYEPFERVRHCLLALFAAGLGWAAAWLVAGSGGSGRVAQGDCSPRAPIEPGLPD
jgi:hypothetical protein